MNGYFWFTLSLAVLVLYLIYHHIRNGEMLLGPVPKDRAEAFHYWFHTLRFLLLAVAFLGLFVYGLWNLYWHGEFGTK